MTMVKMENDIIPGISMVKQRIGQGDHAILERVYENKMRIYQPKLSCN